MLDLNSHIGNDDGELVAGGENYIETCDPGEYGPESSGFFIHADCKKKNGNVIDTSLDINKNVGNVDGILEWEDCNQLLAKIVDKFAAVEEEIALSGRKLLNHWSEFDEENNLHNMMWVCVLVVINMHSYTCALKAVVMKRDRCIYKNIVWKYSNFVCSPCTREERKSA